VHCRNIARDLRGSSGDLLNADGDVLSGGALLLHGVGDLIGNLRDLIDRAADLLDRCHRNLGADCIPAICVLISSVALAVCAASAFTSWATTAKPRPASPARAASMVAFSARRLVCSAMPVISLTTSPILPAASDSAVMRAS